MLGGFHAPRALDENAPHGLRGGGEEVAAAVPVLHLVYVHEPDVGFVDQGRRLERVAGLFMCEPLGGEAAPFVVDQRQELRRGVRAVRRGPV